jgi:ATP phosphoribosyltransferase regulatory subunit
MNDFADKDLLPAGMCDVLPPDAEIEASASEQIVAYFSSFGYERVKPPLIEFEESLLSGGGAAMAEQTFRIMDPISQRMMGVRADMTLQVARIATTRLKKLTRPIRLCYGGQVLRVRGTQIRPERQFGQVGSELIGSLSPAADAEVILMAIEALYALGIENLSIDIALPTLVPALIHDLKLDNKTLEELRAALDRKDESKIVNLASDLGQDATHQLTTILRATGPAASALTSLAKLNLPETAVGECTALERVIHDIRSAAPKLNLTVDLVESRGLKYHTGVTFTIFAKNVRGELGRGGRYLAGSKGPEESEPATGITLFMDSVLRAMPATLKENRLYLPTATDIGLARKFRCEGWITVTGLESNGGDKAEASRLDCSHFLSNGIIQKI